jgi:hypothetical protein
MMTGSNMPSLYGAPLSKSQAAEVFDQLGLVMKSSWFRNSPRCSALLRHTVEAAIHGRALQLRERQIGVEVFHRSPGYDTDGDPVVRIAAGDIRKRLAQYYCGPDTAGQIRIELPIGSYVPSFHFPIQEDLPVKQPRLKLTLKALELQENGAEAALTGTGTTLLNQPHRTSPGGRWIWLALAAFLVLLVGGGETWVRLHPNHEASGLDLFWAPILSMQRRAFLNIGVNFPTFDSISEVEQVGASPSGRRASDKPPVKVPMWLANEGAAGARISEFLGKNHKDFDLTSAFNDEGFYFLLNKPVIIVGDNTESWTTHFTDSMRYRLELDSAHQVKWISDREKPTERIGEISMGAPAPVKYEDYALVARTFDSTTGGPVMVLAGVTSMGTMAAAQFVTEPSYLNDFMRTAPKGWSSKNIEFLISVPVVGNVPGHARIAAYYVW